MNTITKFLGAYKNIFKKPVVVHPILIILLTVLRDINASIFDFTSSILLPFLIINIIYAVAFFLLENSLRSWIISSSATFLIFFINDLHFIFVQVLYKIGISFPFQNIIVAIFLVLVLIFWIFVIIKKIEDLFKLNSLFNFLTITFFVVNSVISLKHEPIKLDLVEKHLADTLLYNSDGNKPDIYFLVFDSYTSDTSLNNFWNFDNSKLYNYLNSKGFFVSGSNICNYDWTYFSLASEMNLSYLNIDNSTVLSTESIKEAKELIRNNFAFKFLSKLNYNFINLSFFDFYNNKAFYNDYILNKYEASFSKHKLMQKDVDDLTPLIKVNQNIISLTKQVPDNITNKPSLIYAHFMLPHFPYFFNKDGRILVKEWRDVKKFDKWKYLEQLQYTNSVIKNVIDTIISREREKIIIIQGDHGYRMIRGEMNNAEASAVYFAVYFPDGDYKDFYLTKSLVNTFRIIFNKLFLTNFSLLNDKSFNIFPETLRKPL